MTKICTTRGQLLLKAGDPFPDMIIRPLLNAPVQQLDLWTTRKKLFILNFFGTWCSPCLPEMDSLAILQRNNAGHIQVIAISNESAQRLAKYLQQKPSKLWLASDTSQQLYKQFGFAYVGQSAIIDRRHRIVALLRTDSINQLVIDKLLRGETVISSAEICIKGPVNGELFTIDSTLDFQVNWSSHQQGYSSMSRTYRHTIWEGRRLTYINVCPALIYQDIYHVTHSQVVYEIPRSEVCDWNNKRTLYCFDMLVRPGQKDSLQILARQILPQLLPIKARLERRIIPVYSLRQSANAPQWPASVSTQNESSFSGQGFDGKGIGMVPFIDYLSNELQLPVVDDTGLKGRYDIHTENVMRTKDDLFNALAKLGLTVEKTSREMDVVVIFK